MRFGTRTELGRRRTACGVRPSSEQVIGYEYSYLSVALNPRTGELFALLLPDMRVESFQAFLTNSTNSSEKRGLFVLSPTVRQPIAVRGSKLVKLPPPEAVA